MIPYVCPVAFGEPGSEMLLMWLRAYEKSGSTLPVCVISDGQPMDSHGLPVAPYVGDWPPMTGAMHKAGAIKIAAPMAIADHLGFDGPVIAVDCDIVQLHPLDDMVSVCTGHTMAIAPNAWQTTWPWLPELRDEKNTGLMWLDGTDPLDMWLELWPAIYNNTPEAREVGYSDEIVQSLIWQRLGGPELDSLWNLSHRCTEQFQDAYAIHFHGPNKDKMAAFMRERGIV